MPPAQEGRFRAEFGCLGRAYEALFPWEDVHGDGALVFGDRWSTRRRRPPRRAGPSPIAQGTTSAKRPRCCQERRSLADQSRVHAETSSRISVSGTRCTRRSGSSRWCCFLRSRLRSADHLSLLSVFSVKRGAIRETASAPNSFACVARLVWRYRSWRVRFPHTSANRRTSRGKTRQRQAAGCLALERSNAAARCEPR